MRELEVRILAACKEHAEAYLSGPETNNAAGLRQDAAPSDGQDIVALYMRMVSGEIDTESFQQMKASLGRKETIQGETQPVGSQTRTALKKLLKADILAKDHVDLFVEMVSVFPDGSITISWKNAASGSGSQQAIVEGFPKTNKREGRNKYA